VRTRTRNEGCRLHGGLGRYDNGGSGAGRRSASADLGYNGRAAWSNVGAKAEQFRPEGSPGANCLAVRDRAHR